MRLAEGIAALGLALPAGAEEKLTAYLALLAKWNRVYNLTAIRAPDEMVTHHLLDSLAVLPVIEAALARRSGAAAQAQPVGAAAKSALAGRPYRLADIGSGAGLPGLVLAIARPQWQIVSIEAVEKKAAFQRQVAIELKLANVSLHCRRVEEVAERCDAAIARAFASLAEFAAAAGHLADTLWAMKGGYPGEEIAALPAGWRLIGCQRLVVPGLAAERHLLQLGRT
ncbi:MAG: 16S rRNA (guanine(527)-N(7))-methyltransferase RsmG [Rhodocyclaceae bacterium]|nr:16S rRNA (guanine(527)-N(7))-methyltransferase RsmG [Rhodocyclaceae bacterium]